MCTVLLNELVIILLRIVPAVTGAATTGATLNLGALAPLAGLGLAGAALGAGFGLIAASAAARSGGRGGGGRSTFSSSG